MISKAWATLWRLGLMIGVLGFAASVLMAAARFPWIGGPLLIGIAYRMVKRRHRASENYGSATMTDSRQLGPSWYSGDGPIIGRSLEGKPGRMEAFRALFSSRFPSNVACRMVLAAALHRDWLGGRILRLPNYVHIATFSPAGGGKSAAVLGPNLKSYAGSCVVVDPKAELALLAGKFRKRRFGHAVYYLNPFKVGGLESHSINPLDFIDASAPDFIETVRDLANMIVLRTGKEHETHWNDSCEMVLVAVIAFVCACEPDKTKRNFTSVRKILTNPAVFEAAKERMMNSPELGGLLADLGGSIAWFKDKELGSVLTTVMRHTAFMDSPLVAASLAKSSFDPMILRQRRATIFLILSHNTLVSLAPLQRLWIGTIMRRITSGEPTEKNPVLWLLDEMAHIGKMQAIEDAFTLMRGMGMRLWVFFQSREQLKKCFGDNAGTVLDNIGTQQYFNITSYETAKELSDRIGDTTIAIETDSDSTSTSQSIGGDSPGNKPPGSLSRSRTRNRSEIARKLITADEILTMPELALVFHKNMRVLPCSLVKHFNAKEFKRGGTGRNPGLGLSGGLAAALVLAICFALSAVMLGVANMPVEPDRPIYPPRRVQPHYGPGYGPYPARNDRRFGQYPRFAR